MSRLMTKDGLKKIEEEFLKRTTTVRQSIAQAIKEAKEQGDLSENAEYSEAKSEQTENESRIAELDGMIKEAEVVEHNSKSDDIQIGSKVSVKIGKQDLIFHIVGSNEANPEERKISNESPIGKALMGKKKGATVTVETPAGSTTYEVVEVK